jgi:NAD dependent epimerase/dehydratase
MVLKGKKVLVTGADGFIGSHLVEALLREGCDVRAFVLYNSFNSWGWLDSMPEKTRDAIEVFAGDIRDAHGVAEAMKEVDCVFHLAALIGIPFSYQSPDSYIDTNVKGTLNIVQAARDAGIGRVIVTSTSEVYGTARYTPIDETHPLQGQSPYSASKIGADKIAESFYMSFGLPVVIVRPFNTYGPRQSARAIIPTIITQALSDSRVISLGALSPRRDLNYVEDICGGFLALAKCDKAIGQTVNIASGSEISIRDLAKLVLELTGSGKRIVAEKCRMRPVNSEVERLLGSNARMKRLTGWRPAHSLEQGLEKTVAWFKNKDNARLYKPGIYNV